MKNFIIDPTTFFCLLIWFIILVVFVCFKSWQTQKELKDYVEKRLNEHKYQIKIAYKDVKMIIDKNKTNHE